MASNSTPKKQKAVDILIYFSSFGESNDPGGEGCLDNTISETRLYKWTVLSEMRKENRKLRRTSTAALKHAAAAVHGIVFPPQAGQGEVNLNCSKEDSDQKVKFPNIVRHWRRLPGVLIESLLLKVSKSRLGKHLSKMVYI